jgi:hypothetical protein
MSNKKIEIVELSVIKRVQLQYCAEVTYSFYSEQQYTAEAATHSFESYESFPKLIKGINEVLKEKVRNYRDDNFMEIRKKNGWIV